MKQLSDDTLFERHFSAWKAGRPALTVLYGRQFVARDPDCAIAWLMLGSALTDIANYEEAEKAIARALELLPPEKRHLGYSDMGHLHQERGDLEQAKTWYRQTIDALPADARGYVYLGGLVARQGQLHEAEEIHRAATERCDEDKGLEEAFLNLGLVLRAQGRFEEAARCFKETLRIEPGSRPAKKALRDVERCLKAISQLAERSTRG